MFFRTRINIFVEKPDTMSNSDEVKVIEIKKSIFEDNNRDADNLRA